MAAAAPAPINYDDATKRLLNKLKTKYGIPERQMQQALPNFNPQEPDNVYTQADYDKMMSNVRGWKKYNPYFSCIQHKHHLPLVKYFFLIFFLI